MTVISTLITSAGTVHATDSLLTNLLADGRCEPVEWAQTKIIPVPAWRGAMSYWGLAQIEGRWSTLDWLRNEAARAGDFGSAEAFAEELAGRLNRELSAMTFRRQTDAGIGIHFSAYERVDDRWIPELFLISNWTDPSYSNTRATGVGFSRETHGTLSGQGPNQDDSKQDRRITVSDAIIAGTWLRYNNGDPRLYNRAAGAIQDMFRELAARRILRDPNSLETLRSLARRPVQVVSEIQHDFCAPGTRVVGGRVHDLAITSTGAYSSTSGDDI